MPAAVAVVRDLTAALSGKQTRGPHQEVAFILNDPFAGGTHLPDITVITPVFAGAELLGFAAARAHHADVGGPVPGSMPANSRTLADEGVVISPRVLDEAAIDELTEQMRRPDQRRADLRAQLAACARGGQRLRELHRRLGDERLRATFAAVLDYAERRTRACIEALPDGTRQARDVLELEAHDLEITVRATVDGDRLTLDFTGSAPQHDGNLNCPLAVTRSACYFAVRVLTDPDIPASAGAYRPVEVIAPPGSLLNARRPAAVAAGNVETSSRVADVVLAAFGRALGQGTMNNVTLGSDEVVYYETTGGGQGACEDAAGPSGVHVAMSNTLNTPVEALELEYPLRMVQYSLRRGSGGGGRYRGGDGVVRELEALAPLQYSLITERRRIGPPGAAGGRAGRPGSNLLDGHELPAKITGRIEPGQRLRIETQAAAGMVCRYDRGPAPMKIAFLGLGIMGSRMAANLVRADHDVTVWNRTSATADDFVAQTPGRTAGGDAARLGDRRRDRVHDGRRRTAGRNAATRRRGSGGRGQARNAVRRLLDDRPQLRALDRYGTGQSPVRAFSTRPSRVPPHAPRMEP